MAQFQCPLVHVHDMAELHGSVPPLEHVEPSGPQAERGSGGSHGLKSVGHAALGQLQLVPRHTQAEEGGGPWQVGGHVERSRVPGGQAQPAAVQMGESPASPPHELTQMSGEPPPHPPSPIGPESTSRPWVSAQPAAASGTRRARKSGRRRMPGPGASSVPTVFCAALCRPLGDRQPAQRW